MFLAAQSVFAVITSCCCTSTSACRLDVARCAGTFPILSSADLDSFSALDSLSLAAASSSGPTIEGWLATAPTGWVRSTPPRLDVRVTFSSPLWPRSGI
ncbi:hypothetical protein QBC34DRAFT_391344 [Podospora aff. communis PSN243]|uniref:Secreted protein n=1 Tax=Podospora aff. communis PSN243 TaxID=3040156 RepID=A0AAV9H665_9PEZI|nr:hypothetical protein QBC34DRAFT_391344 [Podospora aff. communis PSN243]